MFSVLVFMCRDPGDATSKVSCCVETSYCFENRDFDAIVKVPIAMPLKISLPKYETTVNFKSTTFVVIMLLDEGLTHLHSQKKASVAFWREFHLK